MKKLEKMLESKICNISVKDWSDLIGYATSVSVVGLITAQATFSYILYGDAFVHAELSHFNEQFLEIPILFYATMWNAVKLINYYRHGKFDRKVRK